MELRAGGIDCFYVDESGYEGWHVTTAIRVPFLRQADGRWSFEWQGYLDQADRWRRTLSKDHSIKFRTELHGNKLVMCKGVYHKSGKNLSPEEAFSAYNDALSRITFLPKNSIITVAANEKTSLFGWTGVEASIMALLQRIRTHCDTEVENRNGLIFFDEGHDEYTRYFRRACVYLPTGSTFGPPRNVPLAMFTKDGNFKKSHFSYFIQIADLICYAALQKMRFEAGTLNAKRVNRGHHTLYDSLPRAVINLAASTKRKDGIVCI